MTNESDQERLTRLALRTLEEVTAQAKHRPVEHSWGIALALAYLHSVGLMKRWQAETFWREMSADYPEQASGEYVRVRQNGESG